MQQQDTERLDQALQANALVLTPNYRSSDQLIDAVCRYRETRDGCATRERPAIMAIDTWLRTMWTSASFIIQNAQSRCRIMDSARENLLWQQIIRHNAEGLLLLQQDSAAESMATACRLLQQWQVKLDVPGRILGTTTNLPRDDLQWAAYWLDCFEKYCKKEAVLTFGGMVQQLVTMLNATPRLHALLPVSLQLWQFDQPPPLYRDLFAALESGGCDVIYLHQTPGNPQLSAFSLPGVKDECMHAAKWARQVMNDSPDALVGIICPDPAVLKGPLQRTMSRQFSGHEYLFSSSLTVRLSELHWFATAMQTLEITGKPLRVNTLCSLLRSRFLRGANEESDQRAALERRIRELDELQISIADLQYHCRQQDKPWHCPVIDQLLGESRERWQNMRGERPLSTWYVLLQTHWESWLPREQMHTHGHASLTTDLDEFLIVLQQSAAFTGQADTGTFITLVKTLLHNSNARENQRQTPVTLLTPVAATGMQFTHVWCMGMNEDHWPAVLRPHPWLPVSLQRQHGMPGCDHNRTLDQAQDMLQQIIAGTSAQLVFSFAELSEDMPLSPSPLLPEGLQIIRIPVSPFDGLPDSFRLADPVLLETVQDSRLLPTAPLQGSSALLRLQAQCPFRAFAEERLAIKPLNTPGFGLSPAAIGTLVHEVMLRFWQQMEQPQKLRQCDRASLDKHIQDAVTHGLNSLGRRYPYALTPGLRQLEATRLAALLQEWLKAELARGEFTIVALEEKMQWTWQQLTLRLRLDRVDRTASGLAVIDYKTGKTGSNTWGSTVPEQFQLLLYLFAIEQQQSVQVSTLLYGALHPTQMEYTGISADESTLPALAFSNKALKVAESQWQAVRDRWQSELLVLARELLDGYVPVAPRQANACQYCELGPLCRVGELESLS